ncbi:Metallo-dependent phosphatase-like protein [Crucibulum laeve]|uniref:Metallo-dependent phosphatase-like protein n=1 Tax=Crucibulum laeve TaxID=68775 RepID=A0A5C3M506_9AGAR|nr:Metallo-dependent phosphatase-like protein [Crucibulum laeve]
MQSAACHILAFCLITASLVFALLRGFVDNARWSLNSVEEYIPDFSRYEYIRTLSELEFPVDDPHRRVIVVGDIHGMIRPFQTLLEHISYTPTSDVLIHVGDFITKGPHKGSMSTLQFMTTHNITGVRGNHDQKVIEWRGWLDWIQTLPGGRSWLASTYRRWKAAERRGEKLAHWVKGERRRSHGQAEAKWWALVPVNWVLFSDQYKIATELSQEQMRYLLALPLKLYIPSAHTFIVHAGLLPSDPRYPYWHGRQPLATVPRKLDGEMGVEEHGDEGEVNATVHYMRTIQEVALLTQVPQNTDPWVTLNMRGLIGDKVTRSKKGKPWSQVWKHDMSHCAGFDYEKIISTKTGKHSLPCYPSTVIYGHAAMRGLDIKRWTLGLDSGCVYKRELTALVIGPKTRESSFSNTFDNEEVKEDEYELYEDEDSFGDPPVDAQSVLENVLDSRSPKSHFESQSQPLHAEKSKKNGAIVKFGDTGWARVVKVKCTA